MVTPMRRRVTTVMSVTTAVVIGLSLRASAQGHTGPLAVAPAGVVTPAPRTATASSAPPTQTPRSHKTRATRSPKVPTSSQPPKTAQTPKSSQPPKTAQTPKTSKAPSTAPTPSPTSITVNGGVADTMYGPMQVQITVRGNRITAAHAIVYPQGGGRDQQINSQAIPLLDQETLQIQSSQIDTVSGATYTSDGYRRSLQSALDAAHL
jgi:uncharacterized protein with FMN-binding domain